MKEPLLVCPQCESGEVVVYEERAVNANTFEHFCLSVKVHDSDAKARCQQPSAFTMRYRKEEYDQRN